MTIQLSSRPGEAITARRIPVDVALGLIAELPMDIHIHIQPDAYQVTEPYRNSFLDWIESQQAHRRSDGPV